MFSGLTGRCSLVAISIAAGVGAMPGPIAQGAFAQAAATPDVVRIWPGVAPGSEAWTHQEREVDANVPGVGAIQSFEDVVTPTLTIFRPARGTANGTAVIVCPGGGYQKLMFNYEGTDIARRLTARGVTAFVLKYRTQPVGQIDLIAMMTELQTTKNFDATIRKLDAGRSYAIADGLQAIRYVRAHAAQYGVAPDHIGIMGFSAGAGLVMGVLLDHDAASRPDFAAPIYGYMDDRPAPADAPPIFVAATQEDQIVPIEQSVRIFLRWNQAHKPAELHVFQKGPHGFGARTLGLPVDNWYAAFESWMKSAGLLTPKHG